jgi:hypothetical protein
MNLSRSFVVCLAVFTMACAKNRHDPSPPPPCQAGVNQQTCANDIVGHSLWKWQPQLKAEPQFSDSDLDADPEIHDHTLNPEVKDANYDVYWEFFNDGTVRHARRYIVIRTARHTLSYVESGEVQDKNDSLDFKITASSCDDRWATSSSSATSINYWRQSNEFMTLDVGPIDRRQKDLGAALGQIFGLLIESPFIAIGESLLNMAGMNNVLSNAWGQYTAESAPVAFGQVGCFGPIQSFRSSSMTVESWQSK